MTDDPGKPAKAARPKADRSPSRQQVFTLLVEVGRKQGDGLPEGSTGAALLIYASGVDEAEAVRETVAILKRADLAPLDVTGHGTLEEQLSDGADIGPDERALMQRALDENSVIVAQMTPSTTDPNPPDAAPPALRATLPHVPGGGGGGGGVGGWATPPPGSRTRRPP